MEHGRAARAEAESAVHLARANLRLFNLGLAPTPGQQPVRKELEEGDWSSCETEPDGDEEDVVLEEEDARAARRAKQVLTLTP